MKSDFERHRIKPWPRDGSEEDYYRSNPSFWRWEDQSLRRTVTGQEFLNVQRRLDEHDEQIGELKAQRAKRGGRHEHRHRD